MVKKANLRKRGGRYQPYTTGTLNQAVDLALHPLIRKYGVPVIVADSALHALIERNPKTSFVKFLKYNLPPLIRELTKKRRGG